MSLPRNGKQLSQRLKGGKALPGRQLIKRALWEIIQRSHNGKLKEAAQDKLADLTDEEDDGDAGDSWPARIQAVLDDASLDDTAKKKKIAELLSGSDDGLLMDDDQGDDDEDGMEQARHDLRAIRQTGRRCKKLLREYKQMNEQREKRSAVPAFTPKPNKKIKPVLRFGR